MPRDPTHRPRVAPVLTDARRPSSVLLPAVVLIAVVVLGAFGRLVPGPDAASRWAASSGSPDPPGVARPAPSTGPRLLVPAADVLWIGTTEIEARGTVAAGVAAVEALVVADGEPLGRATLDVDASGRFAGVVAITPPAKRTAARLEVRELGREGPPMAEVGFLVEAGSAVLIVGTSSLRGRVGETVIVDVLTYQSVHEIHAVVTRPDGTLIAEAASPATRGGSPSHGAPATVMLRISIPAAIRPTFARLHIRALDRSGHEVSHIDANLPIAAGG